MKRIIVAAVAAASFAAAAPASAQLDEVAIAEPNIHCLTPVTKCVDELADRLVASVERLYQRVGDIVKDGPDLGSYCELIWEDGCGTDAVPF